MGNKLQVCLLQCLIGSEINYDMTSLELSSAEEGTFKFSLLEGIMNCEESTWFSGWIESGKLNNWKWMKIVNNK